MTGRKTGTPLLLVMRLGELAKKGDLSKFIL